MEAFEADPLTLDVFGPAFIRDYTQMKRAEFVTADTEVSDLERVPAEPLTRVGIH